MTRLSAKYLGKRLLIAYVTLLVIMTLIFLLLRAMPGGFVESMITPEMTAAQADRIREVWGANDPLYVQYGRFLVNYQTGNFGWSPHWNEAVWGLLLRRLPRTVILFGAIFVVGYMIGPLVGMYLGWWRGSATDQGVFTGGLLAYSAPVFWLAWLFIWFFNYYTGWLPSAYLKTQFPTFAITPLNVTLDMLRHLALPLLSVAVVAWVGPMLVMRTQMNNVVDTNYVRLARAKGLPERTVMIKHAARNALIPVATSAIVGIAFILDGSVIIENLFNWPGLGQLIITGIVQRDFPTVQALFFVLSVLIIVFRLVTDVVYTYLDPRIDFEEGA